ncbi:MAG: hypothetical protein VX642_14885, partial [Bdellovibrionota bacterium]|nr:hypothetical protein [Bdellovibrionota bacterium]
LKNGYKANAFELDCVWEELGNQKEFIEAHNVVFDLWKDPCSEILKSCIHNFAPISLKKQLLNLEPEKPGNIHSHLESSTGGGWNINLSGFDVSNIDSYSQCIFLGLPNGEESEKYQQIFL